MPADADGLYFRLVRFAAALFTRGLCPTIMPYQSSMISVLVFLFTGTTSFSVVPATENPKPVKSKQQPTHPSAGDPSKNPDSEDGKADLGQPPSPVLERQVRTAPVHPIGHCNATPASEVYAPPTTLKPRSVIVTQDDAIQNPVRVDGFPRSTNGPPSLQSVLCA